jgi:hypothetical protein
MKMFKRFAAALLAGVMVLAMLTAAVALVALVKVSSRRKFRMYIWLH